MGPGEESTPRIRVDHTPKNKHDVREGTLIHSFWRPATLPIGAGRRRSRALQLPLAYGHPSGAIRAKGSEGSRARAFSERPTAIADYI